MSERARGDGASAEQGMGTDWVRSRVVVGVGMDSRSAHALVRADDAARALSAELVIVHVVPSRVRAEPVSAVDPRSDTSGSATRVRSWSEAILGRALPGVTIAMGRGPVADSLLGAADELDAALVVVGSGGLSRALAKCSARPLLVVRRALGTRRVVAFTDFSDAGFPVLRRAAELARGAGAPVTFVGSRGAGVLRARTRASQLGAMARDYERVEVLLSERPATVDDTLAAARLRSADLLAVPTHPRSIWMRAGVPDLGCRIARAAENSVLLVPIMQPSAPAPQR